MKKVRIPTDQGKELDGFEASDGTQFVGQAGEKQAGEHEKRIAASVGESDRSRCRRRWAYEDVT